MNSLSKKRKTRTYDEEYFGYSSSPPSNILLGAVLFEYKQLLPNELSVKRKEIIMVEYINYDLGWAVCRRLNNFTEMGYVPLDYLWGEFNNRMTKVAKNIVEIPKKKFRNCLSDTKGEVTNLKEGSLLLVHEINEKEDWCGCFCFVLRNFFEFGGDFVWSWPIFRSPKNFTFKTLSCSWSNLIEDFSCYLNNNKIKFIKLESFEGYLKKKTNNVSLQFLVKKLPFRIVLMILGEYCSFCFEDEFKMSEIYGKFIQDRTRTIFCVFRMLKFTEGQILKAYKLSKRKIPFLPLKEIEYLYSPIFFNERPQMVRFASLQAELFILKNCKKIKKIEVLFEFTEDLCLLKSISKKLEYFERLYVKYYSLHLLKELSKFKNLRMLKLVFQNTNFVTSKVEDANTDFLDLASLKTLFILFKIVETPVYMVPNQWEGVNVFNLGNIFFEKLQCVKKIVLQRIYISFRKVRGIVNCKSIKELIIIDCECDEIVNFFEIFQIKSLKSLKLFGSFRQSEEERRNLKFVEGKESFLEEIFLDFHEFKLIPTKFLSELSLIKSLRRLKVPNGFMGKTREQRYILENKFPQNKLFQ